MGSNPGQVSRLKWTLSQWHFENLPYRLLDHWVLVQGRSSIADRSSGNAEWIKVVTAIQRVARMTWLRSAGLFATTMPTVLSQASRGMNLFRRLFTFACNGFALRSLTWL